MQVVFRVDSSLEIGYGHIMRCLVLGKELEKLGASVSFISKLTNNSLDFLIQSQGFQLFLLPNNMREQSNRNVNQNQNLTLTKAEQEEDARQSLSCFSKKIKLDWLIVDHYALDRHWENIVKGFVKKIMVIDDLANRYHDCNILLDHNWYVKRTTRYSKLVKSKTKLFLGPKYALLRPSFQMNTKKIDGQSRGLIKRIFIFFGGTDLNNLTSLVLNALHNDKFKRIRIDVVIGKNNPNIEEVKMLINKRKNMFLFVQINDIVSVMIKADIAIASGGINTLERLSIGLFALVITTAENQIETVKDLHDNGFLHYVGDYKNINRSILQDTIDEYIKKPKPMIKNNLGIDGQGAKRVAEYLVNGI